MNNEYENSPVVQPLEDCIDFLKKCCTEFDYASSKQSLCDMSATLSAARSVSV